MPSIRALKQAIIGPSIAQQHESLLATITDREQRLRESPAIKANLASKRERLRAAENQLPKLSAALRTVRTALVGSGSVNAGGNERPSPGD